MKIEKINENKIRCILTRDDLEVRHIMYNKTLDDLKELERKGLVYIIRPENPVTIGRTERDPEKLQALYDIGRKEGLKHIRNVKSFLGE